MLHRHTGPQGPGPKTTRAKSADREWVGKRASERRVKERRETPAPDTPTQFETELMNEQAKGPNDDSTVWLRWPSSPTLDTAHVVGRGCEAKHWEKIRWPLSRHDDHSPHTVEQQSIRLPYLIKLGERAYTLTRTHAYGTYTTALFSLDSHGGGQRGLRQPTWWWAEK